MTSGVLLPRTRQQAQSGNTKPPSLINQPQFIDHPTPIAMFHKSLIPRLPSASPLSRHSTIRTMATVRSSLSHEERTAQEPREARLEPVTVSRIDTVNNTIRLIRLSALNPTHTLKVHISHKSISLLLESLD